jgi:hypothetical protein
MLTVEQLKQALPAHMKSSASQELCDRVNQYAGDPEFAKSLRDNLVSYTSVLKDGKFKTEDYVSAVTYTSLKLMGFNNQESYARTFPDRYQNLVARGADAKEISAYVAAYSKNKLVNLVLEQTLVPTWVLNQDVYQNAINTQALLMVTAKSEMVRMQAANSIMMALKRPEKTQVELNLGDAATSGLNDLRDMLTNLAQAQQTAIGSGMNTQAIAHQKLQRSPPIEAEYQDVTAP